MIDIDQMDFVRKTKQCNAMEYTNQLNVPPMPIYGI